MCTYIPTLHQWWDRLSVTDAAHPLRVFALHLLSIVPHSAKVECLFSNLGGVQSVRQSRLTVEVLSTLGMLRTHYAAEFQEDLTSRGVDVRRRHAHMHTELNGGSHTSTMDDLLSDLTVNDTSPSTGTDPTAAAASPTAASTPQAPQDPNAPEKESGLAFSEDELERAFAQLELEDQGEPAIMPFRDGRYVKASDIYPLNELNAVLAGDSGDPGTVQTAMQLGTSTSASAWTPAALMDSMGLSQY